MFISLIFTAANGIACMDQEALKKLNKNKKLVKKLAKKYNAFMASDTLIKQVGVAGRGWCTGRGRGSGPVYGSGWEYGSESRHRGRLQSQRSPGVPSVCRFPVFWDRD